MEKLYKYEDDMTFDFTGDTAGKSPETVADTIQNDIIDYFQRMAKFNLYFRLIGDKGQTPAGTYPFEVIGTMPDLIKWCEDEWHGDISLIEETAKLVN